MELTRRAFARCLAAAAAAWTFARAVPDRVRRAARARRFPGRLRPLDANRSARPGPWVG